MDLPDLTEEELIRLSCEFQGLRTYSDKLRFFDKHFSVTPFVFPAFQSDLVMFFGVENSAVFEDIFRNERSHVARLEQRIPAAGPCYFNVKPSNSNAPVFNDFILTKYLSDAPGIDELVRHQMRSLRHKEEVQDLLDAAIHSLSYVEYKSKVEHDRSLATQFMKVFYRGYCDYNSGVRQPLIRKKRKFIELYLYVQGQLYGRYMSLLNKSLNLTRPARAPRKPSRKPSRNTASPEGVSLLKDLGIVEILRERSRSHGDADPEKRTIELICRITGEDAGTVSRQLLNLG